MLNLNFRETLGGKGNGSGTVMGLLRTEPGEGSNSEHVEYQIEQMNSPEAESSELEQDDESGCDYISVSQTLQLSPPTSSLHQTNWRGDPVK